ncbi:MAG: hypothetical protein JNM54_17125 [Candidatus Accumulibacter sp.]|uniref:hypothetical protein n=1 Tax=Accumulibacter sp. TaxID=2053492 RepID=UPI001A39011F|nr:hypothetical protein [Accumulibacter sp.]MBL8369622.1 hypothetical protein [Accumulibacter sp.]
MTENKSTLLERLCKRSFPMDELYAAKKNTHLAPLAELILASQQIAAQASEQWEFKSLAQIGREDFILFATIYDYSRWEDEAQKELAFYVTQFILNEVGEGLLFFVEGEDGRHRVARSGDKPYDFVRRLEAEEAVFGLRFTRTPTWASELFLGHENFEAYKLVWKDWSGISNAKYEACKNLRADAVIRETVRRMGSIPGFPSDGKVIDVSPDKHLTSAERDHVSPKLATLHAAAMRFWGNADRDDRGTHPRNADVAAWLIERGYSATLADKAVSIIRPEWAPSGRKPEE